MSYHILFKKNKMNKTIFLILASIPLLLDCQSNSNKYLILKRDKTTYKYSYYNIEGKKILGEYFDALTDTLKDYAIVADPNYILIDKKGKKVYDLFIVDNAPDITSEGLYRIVKDNKIGYVDSLNSKIIIQPIYECAYPFKGGKAKVSLNCSKVMNGEYTSWKSNSWFYIDKNGNRVN